MTQPPGYRYNSPPNWPVPGKDWTPPPGWQPDPQWGPAPDGWPFWVPVEQPGAVPPPPGGWPEQTGPQVDNALGWLIVAAPLLFVCIDVVLYLSHVVGADGVSLFVALAINIALVVLDSRLLHRAGYAVNVWWVFLIPVYLWDRAKRTGQSLAMPAAWVVTFVVSIAGSTAVASALGPVVMDMPYVEGFIAEQLDQQAGTDSTVDCPGTDTYFEGDTFECRASDASGAIIVRVAIEKNDGTFTWEPVGPAS